MRPDQFERLERKLTRDPSGCWIWTGALTPEGYGSIRNKGMGSTMVHREVYEHLVAPIPDALQIDHLCRNRACCNPQHLEPVTTRENTLRGAGPTALNAAKTHCIRGHELSGPNLYTSPDGRRRCRSCRHADDKHRYALNGAERARHSRAQKRLLGAEKE